MTLEEGWGSAANSSLLFFNQGRICERTVVSGDLWSNSNKVLIVVVVFLFLSFFFVNGSTLVYQVLPSWMHSVRTPESSFSMRGLWQIKPFQLPCTLSKWGRKFPRKLFGISTSYFCLNRPRIAFKEFCFHLCLLSAHLVFVRTFSLKTLEQILAFNHLFASCLCWSFSSWYLFSGYLEDSFVKSGVFNVSELVRVSRSK